MQQYNLTGGVYSHWQQCCEQCSEHQPDLPVSRYTSRSLERCSCRCKGFSSVRPGGGGGLIGEEVRGVAKFGVFC